MECFEENLERGLEWESILKFRRRFHINRYTKCIFIVFHTSTVLKPGNKYFFKRMTWLPPDEYLILTVTHFYFSYTVTRLVSKDRDLLYKIRSRPTARCIFLWTFLHVLILWTRTTSFLKRMVGENGGLKVNTCFVKNFLMQFVKTFFLNG